MKKNRKSEKEYSKKRLFAMDDEYDDDYDEDEEDDDEEDDDEEDDDEEDDDIEEDDDYDDEEDMDDEEDVDDDDDSWSSEDEKRARRRSRPDSCICCSSAFDRRRFSRSIFWRKKTCSKISGK